MSDVTAAPPNPSPAPLRPTPGPDGTIGLTRAEVTRVALALNHLAAVVQWSPIAQPWDEAIATDAAWMAETLGDAATSG